MDVILDDRKDRAGVKFKDADLIGYPIRLTVSKNTIETEEVELKVRRTGEQIAVKIVEAVSTVQEMLKTL